MGFVCEFRTEDRGPTEDVGMHARVVFGKIVIDEVTEARVESHCFLQRRSDAEDHAADRLGSGSLVIQDTAGGEDAPHASQPDLAGVRINAYLREVRSAGLLREIPEPA